VNVGYATFLLEGDNQGFSVRLGRLFT